MDITTANRLYELRKQHGYSQDELADKLNVSRQAISKWERSESSPDTDNLIALARLYGVSLDELLNYTPTNTSADTKDSDAQTTDGNSENNSQSTQSTVNDDKTDAKTFFCANKDDKVYIDENGIYVHDKGGSDVVINGGIAKLVNKVVGTIHIEDGKKTTINGKDVNEGEYVKNGSAVHIKNGHITFDNQKSKNIAIASSIVNGVTFLLCTLAYLLIGSLCNLWHPGWILFFVPFIVGGIFDTIAKRNPSAFPVVFIVLAVYLLLGCGFNMWHPYWAIFFIIPAYYIVVEPIKAAIAKKKKPMFDIEINDAELTNDDSDDESDND